jgi:hypothetical protein
MSGVCYRSTIIGAASTGRRSIIFVRMRSGGCRPSVISCVMSAQRRPISPVREHKAMFRTARPPDKVGRETARAGGPISRTNTGRPCLLLRAPARAAASCGRRSSASARPSSMAAASAPGLVLCIAGGIVRIVVRVVASEDLGGWARREINPLIGVTAHKCERRDCDRDAEPWSVIDCRHSPDTPSLSRLREREGHVAISGRPQNLKIRAIQLPSRNPVVTLLHTPDDLGLEIRSQEIRSKPLVFLW